MHQREVERINFNEIRLNEAGFRNCRRAHTDISELKQSIKEKGLITPMTVWFRESPPHKLLVSGHQRYEAIRQIRDEASGESEPGDDLPFEELFVIKYEGNLNSAIAINITENVQREDLNPADRAEAVNSLVGRVGTQTQAASLLNKSQPWVSQQCKLVSNLIPDALEALRATQVTLRQAMAIAQFVDNAGNKLIEKQIEALDRIINGNPDVRRQRVRNYRSKKDVEDFRVLVLGNNEDEVSDSDINIDDNHKASMVKFLRWFFMEIDTDELLQVPESEIGEIELDLTETRERQRT